MPRSYLSAARPGMMASKVAFCTFALRPMTEASAAARSASVPTTFLPPPGSMNSLGGYVASAATVSVPLSRTAAGTCAAMAGSFGAVIGPLEAEPEPEPDSPLLLFPHAARASDMEARSSRDAAHAVHRFMHPPGGTAGVRARIRLGGNGRAACAAGAPWLQSS